MPQRSEEDKIRPILLCLDHAPDDLSAFNELARKINEIIEKLEKIDDSMEEDEL